MTDTLWYQLDKEVIHLAASKLLPTYAEIFQYMSQKGGRFSLSSKLIHYYEVIGLTEWSNFYFKDYIDQHLDQNQQQINQLRTEIKSQIIEDLGGEPSREEAHEYINQVVISSFSIFDQIEDTPKQFQFIFSDFDELDLDALSPEEKENHLLFWILYKVNFSNYLSVAVHGNTVFYLVNDFIQNHNENSLLKSIQIDPSIIGHFNTYITNKYQLNDVDFIDKLSYRLSNPTNKGEVKYPLLWILFQLTYNFGIYCPELTSRDLLNIYNNSLEQYSEYYLSETQIVQRQRRRFNKKCKVI